MKIVYVIEDFYINGGVERIISEKANIMSAQWGHDVTLVSIYKDTPRPTYRLDDSVRLMFLDIPMANKGGNPLSTAISRIKTLASASARLDKALASINPDIIFFATTLCALLLPFCKTKAKRVFESHSARLYTPYNKLFFLMERKADAVVCLTDDDARQYAKAKRVEVIPNFIEKPETRVTDYSVKKAVAVGRLEHVKGFDILIDCWKDVAKAHPDWTIDIYGEGSLHDSLQAQIDRCGLNGKVVLKGRCNDIIGKYADYSLHIMTSRYEGQPMVLIEAQSCGLPSVSFDFNYGAKDIIKSGYNGIVVPQGDTAQLTRAIRHIIENNALREEYGTNALTTANRFDRQTIMEKWKQLINNLITE